jgi:fructose/tagatose bisphosphate aldolase
MLRTFSTEGELGADIPIALHLDHGDSFELDRTCNDRGVCKILTENPSEFYPRKYWIGCRLTAKEELTYG